VVSGRRLLTDSWHKISDNSFGQVRRTPGFERSLDERKRTRWHRHAVRLRSFRPADSKNNPSSLHGWGLVNRKRDLSGNLIARYTTVPGLYRGIVQNRATKLRYYHAAGLGSVKLLSDARRRLWNSSVTVRRLLLLCGRDTTQPFQFTGRGYTRKSGLYLLPFHILRRHNRRFIARTPLVLRLAQTSIAT